MVSVETGCPFSPACICCRFSLFTDGPIGPSVNTDKFSVHCRHTVVVVVVVVVRRRCIVSTGLKISSNFFVGIGILRTKSTCKSTCRLFAVVTVRTHVVQLQLGVEWHGRRERGCQDNELSMNRMHTYCSENSSRKPSSWLRNNHVIVTTPSHAWMMCWHSGATKRQNVILSILSAFARNYFAVLATSVLSQRVLSVTGYIDSRRCSETKLRRQAHVFTCQLATKITLGVTFPPRPYWNLKHIISGVNASLTLGDDLPLPFSPPLLSPPLPFPPLPILPPPFPPRLSP